MTENEPGAHPGLVPAAFAYAAQVATHGATTSAHMQGGLGFTDKTRAGVAIRYPGMDMAPYQSAKRF